MVGQEGGTCKAAARPEMSAPAVSSCGSSTSWRTVGAMGSVEACLRVARWLSRAEACAGVVCVV
jgi:hypothetical protein